MLVVDEVHHLGLCTARAVNHTMDLRTQLIQQFLDDRGIGACRREYQLAGVNA